MDGNWGEVNNLSKQAPSPKSIKSSKHGTLSKSKSISVTEKPADLSKSKSNSVSVTDKPGALSKSDPLSVTGTSIKSQKPPNTIQKLENSLEPFTPESIKGKILSEVNSAANVENQLPEVSVQHGVAYLATLAGRLVDVAEAGMEHLRVEIPKRLETVINDVQKQAKAEDEPKSEPLSVTGTSIKLQRRHNAVIEGKQPNNVKLMKGGTDPVVEEAKPVKGKKRSFSKIFMVSYIPGVLSLVAFIFLIIFLLWVIIMGLLNRFLGDKYAVPNIQFKKERTQIVYSIFFAITSLVLMFYLFIDYFVIIGPELDIVQIFKQLIGASYILWPMAILIIGSGIAKAFYKISCNGNKPNVLSWAKIVESTALYVLGIAVLITVILLLKPLKGMYERLPEFIKKHFVKFQKSVSVVLKLMVIYILLRMVTIMLEDIISNKLVFFISKLNKNIEAPPVNCNAEEEEKNAKQSEVANILEEIYMYISGIIVCVAITFIVLIQSPHPKVTSVYTLNNKIGLFFLKITGISTRFIGENSYGKKEKGCDKKKGSGFGLSNLVSSFGKTEQSLDDAGAIAAYSRNITNPESAFTPSEADGTGATGYINKRIILINESPTAFKSSGADGTGATGHINRVNESPTAFKPNKADGRDSTQEPKGRLKPLDINQVGTSKIQSLTSTTPLAPIPPTSTAETGADITSEKI